MYKIEKIYENNKIEEFKFNEYQEAYLFFKECFTDLEDIKFIKFYNFDRVYKLKLKYNKDKDLLSKF